MTTAWRCAPCQRMKGIQITQWKWVPGMQFTRENRVQMRVASLKRVGLCWCLACRSVADRVAATRAHASQAASTSCHCNQNFCPPSGSDTHLQIRKAPRSATTRVDVIDWKKNLYSFTWVISCAYCCRLCSIGFYSISSWNIGVNHKMLYDNR